MKVLHVITTLDRGGAENHLVELVRSQILQGADVTVAYLKGRGHWTRFLQDCGVQVVYLGLTRYGELAPLYRLWRLVRGLKPEIVHPHMPPAELYVRLALLGNPSQTLIVSKHNDEPFFKGPGHELLGRWVARRAKKIIAISNAVRAYIGARLYVPNEKLVTIHYGIDSGAYAQVSTAHIAHLRSEWNLPADVLIIGTVARLTPQKALDVLLKAYSRYLLHARCASRLILVGQGEQDAELRRLARFLKIQDSVIWAGFREDIPDVMNLFDVFALTSIYEGFGLVLVEAMAAGRPVVATAVSAIPEIVVDGVTGILVPPGDCENIANAFLRLEDLRERTRLGNAGYDRVSSSFTVKRMSDSTMAVYRECLK